MAPRKKSAKKQQSGAVGGAATAHGMNYQIEYGVLHALDLIAMAFCLPHKRAAISIEPREPAGSNVTAWDLGMEPPDRLVEAKLNPSREDILDWLDRIRVGAQQPGEVEFRLVHSTGGGRLLNSLRQLLRIAKESGSDEEKFRRLIGLEEIEEAKEILSRLGPTAFELLRRIKIENLPESILEHNLQFRLRILAGESGGQRLREFLFSKLSKAAPHRVNFDIQGLISEIQQLGITLHVSPEVNVDDLPSEAVASLVILQSCPSGLSLEVLAASQKLSVADLNSRLAPLFESNLVAVENGICYKNSSPVSFTRSDWPELLSSALFVLLEEIRRRGRSRENYSRVLNAVALARKSSASHPEDVARVFMCLDKHLKDFGDKHFVLEVAELSIASARRAYLRSPQVVEGEAHALICGRSWVLQRVGRLDEARVEANKSLKLGEDMGWGRNSAFCVKCIGRLFRLQAEEAKDSDVKAKLITESILSIQQAIYRFSNLAEYGPNHSEIGDCYSLLGRTYLVAGRRSEADEMIRKAHQLIKESDGKDYADLLILDGDLQASNGDRVAADTLYSDAISYGTDEISDASEIRARGYFQRGRNRLAMGRRELAIGDFQNARSLWEALGEQDAAARAGWSEISASSALSEIFRKKLISELPAVRVKAVQNYQLAVATAGRRGARRQEPGAIYWDQLIEEARREVAIEAREW
jgi:tetratricopeptide (TPR) repeat protein